MTDFRGASPEELAFMDAERRWLETARIKQILPMEDWTTCVALSGRGFGKTKMGASWVRRQAGTYPGSITHVIAPTYADLRGVVFEGPSGLRAEIPAVCVKSLTYSPYPEMVLWNGSIIRGFSSETPDRLRGPQATFVWGDELASWYKAQECLDNINFSTRIALQHRGRTIQPQKFYTTTPRPLQWLAEMIKRQPRMVYGSTYENRANLAESFFDELVQYEGTQIGKQELHGELLDISEAAIIKKSWIKLWPHDQPLPWLEKIYVSMDTAFTEKTFNKKSFEADPTCCTVWGVFKQRRRWNLLLLECWEDWLGFPELCERARKEMERVYGRRELPIFKPLVGREYVRAQVKKPDVLVIEDKGSGISLRQVLEREKVPSFPYNPGKADKLARVHAVSHLPKAGRIWLLESENPDTPGVHKSWVDPLVDQLCVYSGPGTTPHDDWVDSTSQAWRVFADEWVPDGVGKLLPIDGEEDIAQGPESDGPEVYVYHDRGQTVQKVKNPRGAYDG